MKTLVFFQLQIFKSFFQLSGIQLIPIGDKRIQSRSMGQQFPDGRLLMSKMWVKLFKGAIERKLPFCIQKGTDSSDSDNLTDTGQIIDQVSHYWLSFFRICQSQIVLTPLTISVKRKRGTWIDAFLDLFGDFFDDCLHAHHSILILHKKYGSDLDWLQTRVRSGSDP